MRARLRPVLAVALPLLFSGRVAAAADPPAPAADAAPPSDPPAAPVRWYGWQTLAVDAGAALFFAGARATEGGVGSALFVPGFLLYIGGAPAVHGFHHRDGALVADLALRIALPIAGAFLGAAGARCDEATDLPGLCREAAGARGAMGGMTMAAAIDALGLSWERRTVPATARGPAWSPTVALGPHGMSAGIGGAF